MNQDLRACREAASVLMGISFTIATVLVVVSIAFAYHLGRARSDGAQDT